MVRTEKRQGRPAGRGPADQEDETVRGPETGPDEQAERRAPDSPTDLSKGSWGAALRGTVKCSRETS